MPSEKEKREPVLFAWSGGKDSALAFNDAAISKGDVVLRENRFYFCDLLLCNYN